MGVQGELLSVRHDEFVVDLRRFTEESERGDLVVVLSLTLVFIWESGQLELSSCSLLRHFAYARLFFSHTNRET